VTHASFIGFTGTPIEQNDANTRAFLQTVQAALSKQSSGSRKSPEDLDAAVRQLVSKAIVAERQIIDVFTAAGRTAVCGLD
jgi:type I site-specific restriction-modification system R (restriction) subunit